MSLVVTDAAYPYLVLQQGRLDHLKHDRPAWEAAYTAKMALLFAAISPFLPAACRNLLDVGGGMGGIDALISAHYGHDCEVVIVDGLNDAPAMMLHRQTFNDADVAYGFLTANGVRRFMAIPPSMAKAPILAGQAPKYDLVVSFGSWCFHYPPSEYLEFVMARCHPDTVLILEVREGKPEWVLQLLDVFEPVAATVFTKFTRWVFKPRV